MHQPALEGVLDVVKRVVVGCQYWTNAGQNSQVEITPASTPTLSYRDGRSVGKRVMGTQVVRVDGSPVSWAYNFWLRTVLVKGTIIGTVGGMTSGLLSVANYLWPLWDRDAQALHDKMVGTCVVKVPPPSRPAARLGT